MIYVCKDCLPSVSALIQDTNVFRKNVVTYMRSDPKQLISFWYNHLIPQNGYDVKFWIWSSAETGNTQGRTSVRFET